MTNTVTYQSHNALPGQEWMAYVIMPNGKLWMVPAFGSTEKEAVNKIVSLWESERAKISNRPNATIVTDRNGIQHGVSESDTPWQHHLAGLVWLIHKTTREKKRVSPEVAEGMLAFGEWIKGGPRSK